MLNPLTSQKSAGLQENRAVIDNKNSSSKVQESSALDLSKQEKTVDDGRQLEASLDMMNYILDQAVQYMPGEEAGAQYLEQPGCSFWVNNQPPDAFLTPVNIWGMRGTGRGVKYLVEWSNGATSFKSLGECRDTCPHLLENFRKKKRIARHALYRARKKLRKPKAMRLSKSASQYNQTD